MSVKSPFPLAVVSFLETHNLRQKPSTAHRRVGTTSAQYALTLG
ncbi:hypothetical protein F8B43_5083 [Methylorubrum populi]|uniref:Uncharacterized protein n=1 Tax=Methylorubrum populi TaxID=223967 RepID=A0A833J0I9_9HYPH|nr:hypothetical protein F8B43_5083 [Methylorubrum populi]